MLINNMNCAEQIYEPISIAMTKLTTLNVDTDN